MKLKNGSSESALGRQARVARVCKVRMSGQRGSVEGERGERESFIALSYIIQSCAPSDIRADSDILS